MTQLVKINASDYGLEESKAKEISNMFKPMLDKMVELEKEFNELSGKEISKELCTEARTLRLKYIKVRTGTAEIHKGLKAFYLQGGRFVDGWKNAQLMASQGMEGKLSSMERHYEILEEKRISDLYDKRVTELEKYKVDFIPADLGEMESEVWDNYVSGVRLNYEAKIEAEKQAEEKRLEDIRLNKRESKRRERILPYRDYWQGIVDAGTLRDLSDEVFEAAFEKIIAAKKEDEKKQEQVRKDNLRLQKEAEARERKRIVDEKIADEKAEKLRKDNEAELKKAQDENDRIAQELEDKRIAEEQAETERLVKIEAEKKKGDKEKMLDLVADLERIELYKFSSEEYQERQSSIVSEIDYWISGVKDSI